MLYTMKEVLAIAKGNNFAVGAFNIADNVLFKVVIEEAERLNAPVIIQLAPPEVDFVGKEFFKYVVERLKNSKVPCVLHLDHGKTIGDCLKAIQYGFTSVMLDGSELPFETNIALCKQVSEIARQVGVSVEGEIGTIGITGNSVEGGVDKIHYTQPEEVVEFVSKSGVDTLAIAIGTAHGIYPEGMVPKLRLDILEKITEVTDIPLVLHGGSSNSDEEIKNACKLGVNKVNIASDYRLAFFQQTTKTLNETKAFWSPKVYGTAILEAKKVIAHKMELFGCIDKANLFR